MADETSIPNELKELFAKYEELKAGILNRYTQLVTAVLNGEITDENEMEEIMDGLLDYGDEHNADLLLSLIIDKTNVKNKFKTFEI